VGGLALDKDQQLWITNSDALQGLVVKKKDGTTKKFTIPFSYAGYELTKIIVDLDNRKWMIAPNGDGVFCFDHGENIDQIGDDQWRQFKQGLGRGNLPSNQVTSLACDRNGFIWLGTDKGLAVVQCTEELFSASCEAILPVVQQDNFAGRLLSEEIINDIKVDGADRKWIATSNGVWLLSADGQKVISRFTEKNSFLLSDDVRSIVIHQKTGEVFFFTKNGICSFRGTATEPETIEKKPFVFPNPVPPGYTGTIAIRDLPENAWVRITELDGRLVYQTRSLGGQAIWNGKNYKGERASSGIYLLFVSNENNTQQVAGKIFFIK
jgi:ligand-binding sensor domain-containing protein